MKDELNNKKKIIKVIGLIISVILIILLGTYAWFVWNSPQNTELTTTIGQLAEIKYTKGNDISTNELAPVLDYNDGKTTTFSIKNKSNDSYSVYFKLNLTRIDDVLQNENLKYKILKSNDNSNFEPYIEGTFENITVGINNIGNEVLSAKATTYYKFIVYIDGTKDNTVAMMGKSIIGTIDVETTND